MKIFENEEKYNKEKAFNLEINIIIRVEKCYLTFMSTSTIKENSRKRII